MKTTVIHVRRRNELIADGAPPEQFVYCGRPSTWGNPYPLLGDERRREKVCALFKTYFLELIDSVPTFRRDTLALKGKYLVCHCAPKACHVDVIAEWLEAS